MGNRPQMRIIPVIDIKDRLAVQAIAGRREEYKPVKSVLCSSPNPVEVAEAFKTCFNPKELYIADLDAILGGRPNYEVYAEVKAKTGLSLLIDAGINDIRRAKRVLEYGASKIIVGTETLSDLSFVEQALRVFGKDRITISLDLFEGRVLSKSPTIAALGKELPTLARRLERVGVGELIVLELTRVGTGKGIALETALKILKEVQIPVVTGGGIRSIDDLKELERIGVSGALVATAFHTGQITASMLKMAGFL